MKHTLIFTASLFAILLLSCNRASVDNNQDVVKNVMVVKPIFMDNVAVRTFPGVVKAANETNVGFKTAGQISRIAVREGDYVQEGDIIAELDKKDYLLKLEASQIQYNQLKGEVERLKELHKRNNIPTNDYEKAVAGLNALNVQLKADKNTIEYTTLKSPVSGYIQSLNFAKTEMIDAGMSLVTLIDVSTVKVEMELPSSLYLRQNDFISYSCQSNLLKDEDIELKLVGINQKSNNSQLHKVSFVPADIKSELMAGMNVEVKIEMKESGDITTPAYLLPLKTTFKENEKTYVWLVKDNVVTKQEVAIAGIDKNGMLIISSGINDNDEVVKAGIRTLNEGDKISVISEPSKTNVGGLL